MPLRGKTETSIKRWKVRLIRQAKLWPSQPKPNPKKRKENPNKDQACHHSPHDWALEEEHSASISRREVAVQHKKKSEHSDCRFRIHAERKLTYGDQYLHMGNGAQAVVEAIGTFDLVLPSGLDIPKETMGYYFYFPPENKVIVARYGDFLERDLISQEFSGRDCDLEDDHIDTLPSENTSEIPVEPESPWGIGEPANYRAAMIDPDKVFYGKVQWMKEMKSMKVHKVLDCSINHRPPNAKVGINRIRWKLSLVAVIHILRSILPEEYGKKRKIMSIITRKSKEAVLPLRLHATLSETNGCVSKAQWKAVWIRMFVEDLEDAFNK
ncbi:hypothetical protein Tco_0073193 [Tanacetum coccineum]